MQSDSRSSRASFSILSLRCNSSAVCISSGSKGRALASRPASCLAVVVFLLSQGRVSLPTQLVLAWNTFAITSVALAWIVICTKDPYEVRRNARLQDASATFLFVLVISVLLLFAGIAVRSVRSSKGSSLPFVASYIQQLLSDRVLR